MEFENSAIAGMLIPDAMTPGQFYDGIRADDAAIRPIKRLMLAVLEDAMRCYQTYACTHNRAMRRLFVEAEAWLMDRNGDGPFACVTICETLGIDPGCLREGLRRWRIQQMDGMNPRRLARRSPVTRIGRISAPLKRRRRKSAALETDPAAVEEVTANENQSARGERVTRMNDDRPQELDGYGRYHDNEGAGDDGYAGASEHPAFIEVQEAAVA